MASQSGSGPPERPGAEAPPGGRHRYEQVATRWYNVLWRGRVLDSSWGDVEGRFFALAEAMRGAVGVYGTPTFRLVGGRMFAVEVWIGAVDHRLAMQAARRALQHAFEVAGVGDARPGAPELDVTLMLEEWPLVRRGTA